MTLFSINNGASNSAPVPALTLAQAESSTSTVQGTVSGQILAEVIAAEAPLDAPTFHNLTATNGQTVFTLTPAPVNPNSLTFMVNGAEYFPPDYTLSGSTLTWAGSFALATTDTITAMYA